MWVTRRFNPNPAGIVKKISMVNWGKYRRGGGGGGGSGLGRPGERGAAGDCDWY
jgi:hypothetical protein